MKVIEIDLDSVVKEKSLIALGNFDGVHKGHIELIDTAIKRAKELDVKSSALIFKEHTDNLVNINKKEILTNNKTKFEIFENLGLDIVYLIDFTKEFMAYSPMKFLDDFLCKSLNVIGVVVGYDYTYGYKKEGHVNFLLDNKNLFKSVDIIAPVKNQNIKISSSLIRDLIKNGNLKKANYLLTRPYKIIGEVIHAKGLGKKMGYPTANLKLLDNYVIPRFGVYDTDIIIDGKKYKASTSVGTNPTVETNDGVKIEAHILDFNKDIYGKVVELEFLDFIRPEIKFDNVEELFEQISRDVDVTRRR